MRANFVCDRGSEFKLRNQLDIYSEGTRHLSSGSSDVKTFVVVRFLYITNVT